MQVRKGNAREYHNQGKGLSYLSTSWGLVKIQGMGVGLPSIRDVTEFQEDSHNNNKTDRKIDDKDFSQTINKHYKVNKAQLDYIMIKSLKLYFYRKAISFILQQ